VIEQDGDIHAELTEPFGTLLGPTIRALATNDTGPNATDGDPDWRAWEKSFNENTHEENPVGEIARPGGRGLSYDILVGLTGLEPD
jgi:hypothetical protein